MTRQRLELIRPNHLHGWLGTNCTAIGGGGILVNVSQPSNPTIHHSYVEPTGTWCSSFQDEIKTIKKALQIIQTEESPEKDRIVSNSQSVLLRDANLQYPVRALMRVTSKNLLAVLHEEGHQITFTWYSSHCRVVGNEIADEQA